MTAKWWWVTWPRGHQERYGGRSYRQLKRMHELQPFPLERPFGNDVQASRSDLLDERDAANAAAAAEKAAHISAAEESRRAALKTQPRAGGRFVKIKTGKAQKTKTKTTVIAPARRRGRPRKATTTTTTEFIEAAE